MADESKPGSARSLPVAVQERAPARATPNLPSSSGAWFGGRTTLLAKDSKFVRAHADYLAARQEQARQARALVDVRIELERSLARLAWLPEILEHDYQMGREDRRHDFEAKRITNQTREAELRAVLQAALNYEASLKPQPVQQPVSTASAGRGAGIDDVEQILSNFPDIPASAKATFLMLLRAKLQDKA